MEKKIKIIDLLNKIANGEQPPIQIEYKSTRFKLDYIGYKQASYLNNGKCLLEGWNTTMCLTDEVEILDKEDEFEDIDYYDLDNFKYIHRQMKSIIKNQKKIIERLKNLDNN